VKVLFTEAAESDLEAIGDWIAKDNPGRAMTFVRELRRSCVDIGPRPLGYPLSSTVVAKASGEKSTATI
jgi:plasmid stabilization system protein ParE